MKASVSCSPRCGAWAAGSGANAFQALRSSSRVRTKGSLVYLWDHVYLKAKSGPNCGGVINPDSGSSILDSERQK